MSQCGLPEAGCVSGGWRLRTDVLICGYIAAGLPPYFQGFSRSFLHLRVRAKYGAPGLRLASCERLISERWKQRPQDANRQPGAPYPVRNPRGGERSKRSPENTGAARPRCICRLTLLYAGANPATQPPPALHGLTEGRRRWRPPVSPCGLPGPVALAGVVANCDGFRLTQPGRRRQPLANATGPGKPHGLTEGRQRQRPR